jgi:hypothetical protein
MADLIGLNAKLYRGTVNTTPATLMVNYRKLKMAREKTMADNSRHGYQITSSRPTRSKVTLEFEMVNSDTDADVLALQTAFDNDTPLAFKSLDKASGKGIMGDFYVAKFERDEDEDNVQVVSVSLEPTSEYRDCVPI